MNDFNVNIETIVVWTLQKLTTLRIVAIVIDLVFLGRVPYALRNILFNKRVWPFLPDDHVFSYRVVSNVLRI